MSHVRSAGGRPVDGETTIPIVDAGAWESHAPASTMEIVVSPSTVLPRVTVCYLHFGHAVRTHLRPMTVYANSNSERRWCICRRQLCPSLILILADPVVDKTLSARCTVSDDVGRGSGCSAAPPNIPGCSAKAIYGFDSLTHTSYSVDRAFFYRLKLWNFKLTSSYSNFYSTIRS